MAKLVAKTYADALFQLATERSEIDSLFEEVKLLQDLLVQNPELSQLMNHPNIARSEKEEVIENIFKNRVSNDLCGFLVQVVKNDRYEDIPDILECFVAEVKDYKKIGVAYVETPMELTDAQKKKVEEKLTATTDYTTMEMHYTVDPSLIGGMKIRIGDKVVDSSVSTKLAELAKSLRSIQLKNI